MLLAKVRDNAVAARYLTVNIDREIQEVLDRPHINFRLAAAQTRKALGAEQYLVLKYQWVGFASSLLCLINRKQLAGCCCSREPTYRS